MRYCTYYLCAYVVRCCVFLLTNSASTSHAPSHGTREVLIIYGALLSSDPGDIHDTIASLIADRIRVSIIGLSAQVAICAELCARTNGGDDSTYAVVLHEHHFRELFLKATTPPPTLRPAGAGAGAAAQNTRAAAAQVQNGAAKEDGADNNQASLLMMGFPSRALAPKDALTLCACHNRPGREGYACTRCRAKVCRLPSECPACGLTLILSTHLARSYHHLFPLRLWAEVSWAEAARSRDAACFSCLTPFPRPRAAGDGAGAGGISSSEKASAGKSSGGGGGGSRGKDRDQAPPPKGVSESGRYKCQVCGNHFCIDCDVFAHEVLHNCPGCQSDTRGRVVGRRSEDMEVTREAQTVAAADAGNGLNANGHSVLREDLGSGEPDGFLAPQAT